MSSLGLQTDHAKDQPDHLFNRKARLVFCAELTWNLTLFLR